MVTLSEYLLGLRTLRKLSQRDVAKGMQRRFPPRAVGTLLSAIRHYENGFRGLEDALSGIEPHRTLFCLYLEGLKLNEAERSEVSGFLDGNFSFYVDEGSLASLIEKTKQHSNSRVRQQYTEYAQKIPDIGYGIGEVKLVDGKLMITIAEPDNSVRMPDAVNDFRVCVEGTLEHFPDPIALSYRHEGNVLVISPRLRGHRNGKRAIRFLEAYQTALEQNMQNNI